MKPGILQLGAIVRFNDSEQEIIGISTSHSTLRSIETGEISAVVTGELLQAHSDLRGATTEDDRWVDDATTTLGLITDLCSKEQLRRAERLEDHLIEMETGESKHRPPNPAYSQDVPMGDREQAKVDELAGTDLKTSKQSLRRKRKLYVEQGLSGLIDGRSTKKRNQFSQISPAVKALVHAEVQADIPASGATFARFQSRLDENIKKYREAQEAEGNEPGDLSYGSVSTLRRLVANTPGGHRLLGPTTTKRTNARELESTQALTARYPGDVVYLDTTTADVFVIDIDGQPRRPSLTIAVDLRTRLIPAFRFTMSDPNQVDAGELLYDMIAPSVLIDGWETKLAAAVDSVPAERKASYQQRRKELLTRPIVWPDSVVIDSGKIYTSRSFSDACATLGISIDNARLYRGQDKSPVERTFHSLNTLFFQYVKGYTGRSVEYRGYKAEDDACFSIEQLTDMFEEFLILEWQHRKHDGLHVQHLPGVKVSPREMYDLDIAAHGQLPYVATADEAALLLPTVWRTISHDGVAIDGRKYSSKQLEPWMLRRSPFPGKGKTWPFRVHRGDLRHVYFQNPTTGQWLHIPWRHLPSMKGPFGDRVWKEASKLVKERHGASLTKPEQEHQRALAIEELRRKAAAGITTKPSDAPRLAKIFGHDAAIQRTNTPPKPKKPPKADTKPKPTVDFTTHIPQTTTYEENQ